MAFSKPPKATELRAWAISQGYAMLCFAIPAMAAPPRDLGRYFRTLAIKNQTTRDKVRLAF